MASAGKELARGFVPVSGEAWERAYLDPLTRLANRYALDERVSELAAASTPYVIGILDVDDLKKSINDPLGHDKGDELLRVVASTIKHHLPSADIIARLGGDEFAAIFPSMPAEEVFAELTKLNSLLPRYTSEARFPEMTVSGGVSRDDIESFQDKLDDADRSLYHAKVEGRARIKVGPRLDP
jgi:diguanylate cyclase (GGDEF)-like protein